jgi:hypothetical protein
MCIDNDHFHEDFGDEPSVEERIPEHFYEDPIGFDEDFEDEDFEYDDEDFEDDDEDDEEYDAELAADIILERQELEDFEGLNGPFEDFNDGGDW